MKQNYKITKINMEKEIREKLEAIIEHDIENMPYKYRDLRGMFMFGMNYKDMSKQEIDDTFLYLELKVSDQAKEWATYSF